MITAAANDKCRRPRSCGERPVANILMCGCGQRFQAGEEHAGRRVRCPGCGRGLLIPRAGPTAESADPAGLDPILVRTAEKATASLALGLLSLVCAVFAGLPAIVL